jgi:hypothetical protein
MKGMSIEVMVINLKKRASSNFAVLYFSFCDSYDLQFHHRGSYEHYPVVVKHFFHRRKGTRRMGG